MGIVERETCSSDIFSHFLITQSVLTKCWSAGTPVAKRSGTVIASRWKARVFLHVLAAVWISAGLEVRGRVEGGRDGTVVGGSSLGVGQDRQCQCMPYPVSLLGPDRLHRSAQELN